MEVLDKRTNLPKVVGAIAIPHDDILAVHIIEPIDVGSPQTSSRRAQDLPAMFEDNLGRLVSRAVDYQDLTCDAGAFQTFLTPFDKLADAYLLVKSGDHNAHLHWPGHYPRRDKMHYRHWIGPASCKRHVIHVVLPRPLPPRHSLAAVAELRSQCGRTR